MSFVIDLFGQYILVTHQDQGPEGSGLCRSSPTRTHVELCVHLSGIWGPSSEVINQIALIYLSCLAE